MAPTIHQRVNGWLWNWATGPGWVRDGSEMAKLRQDGMRVLKVQLQDNGPVPVEQVAEWNAAGLKVWGAVGHVDGRDPKELAAWLKSEKVRLTSAAAKATLSGFDVNGEEDVRSMDVASGGQWSATFAPELRRLCPTLPLHFDSYWGSIGAGINLRPYRDNAYRLTFQSYEGAEGVWDRPPTEMVQKMAGAQPPWPKSLIKPLHRVSANSAGQLPNWDVVFADHKASGCLGVGWYYIDGADFDLLRWLTREAIRRGCAY